MKIVGSKAIPSAETASCSWRDKNLTPKGNARSQCVNIENKYGMKFKIEPQ
jgi:hypothetical protein